ncbi:MAG: hypothetical protein QNJ14_09660 [Woeseiaceae bacterium]|nr:hypothetical protein [Woeseiaceae bacterium]
MNIMNQIVSGSRRPLRIVAGCFGLLAFAACGGGGGDGGGGTGVLPPPPPPPPPVRQPQAAVFMAVEPNTQDRHLFSAADDGSALTQLTPNFTTTNGAVVQAAVSPDGQTVAYAAAATTDDVVDVYVMPIAGGTPVQVSSGFPAGTGVQSLHWAPDSSQLAYVANPLGRAPRGFRHNEVFLADRDGGNNRKINGSVGSPPVVAVQNPQWSPDGRYLAQGVYSLDPFFTLVGINTFDTTLGAPNSTRINPALDWRNGERLWSDWKWSPDSTQIAFRSEHRVDDQIELYVAPADGTSVVNILQLDQGKDVNGFEWSPNSERLAYWGDVFDVGRVELFTSRRNSSGHIRLSKRGTLTANQSTPISWLPDSTRLVYRLDQDIPGVFEYYLAEMSAAVHPKLHRDLVSGEWVAEAKVSPDGSQISFRSNIESGQSDLFVVDVDLSNQRKLSGTVIANGFGVASHAWSPDSTRIAYNADRNVSARTFELFVATADGLTDNQVSAAIAAGEYVDFARSTDWSNDSTRILFRTIDDSGTFPEPLDLWVGTTDGSAPIMLNGTNDYVGISSY